MPDEGEPAAVRKPRADAERNRVRLLETAKAAFAEKGSAASLDEIARTAGVGAGTLYRHFPTRDALVAAVYRNETEQLVFVDYIATKHGMYEVLNSIVGGTSDLYSASTAQVKQAMAKLVDRAVASGDIRLDLDPLDLLRALAGVANIGLGPDGERAAKHMVDILIAGVRART